MLKEHEQIRLPDENKAHEVILEVNWNPKDKKTNECKYIKIAFDGKEATIKREHFVAAIFAMGTEDQQRKMVPQTTTRSRWYETVISVKAKKDIHKGENITFPLKLTLPSFSEEIIAEAKRDVVERGLISPY